MFGEVGVFNNYIGTNKSGSAAVPNGSIGFWSLEGGSTRVGAVGVDGGGGSVSFGNLISGNRSQGVTMESSFDQRFIPQRIEGNLIGTDRTGTAAIPNSTSATGASAVQMVGIRATVGGIDPLSRNVISGNSGSGVLFSGTGYQPRLINNYIGVDRNGQPLGNAREGVNIFASDVTVGGSEDQANVIAHNGGRGVYVFARENFQQTQSSRNAIRFNSIYSNAALGIDLTVRPSLPITPDGVTPNDCVDIDTQANDRQNFPVLTAPVFNGNGTVSVEGAFQSSVSQSYVIDFYSNSTNDPSNYGEGETYIGSKTIETDNDGQATFLFTSTVAVAPGLKITATATDGAGNTSEFSCFAGQCEGGTGGLAGILEDMALTCLIPIVVNVDTDQPDTSPGNGICDVDLSTPGLQCSLRGAIQTANGKPGFDLVQFDIPGGGVKTISPTSQLPTVNEIVIIDATSQPGYSGSPLIEINGSLAGNSYGLVITGGGNGSSVLGFAINRFTSGGISLTGSRNRVDRSYFGLNADGTAAGTPGQQQIGIDIRTTGSTENIIGGTGSRGNVIANNGIGVAISNGSNGNKIRGNKIGTNVAGTEAIPNQFGVLILSASTNTIGDSETTDANLISGNSSMGIILDQGSANNFVTNNAIGVRSNGTEVLPNGDAGVFLNVGVRNNTIDKNVIGGHTLGSVASGIAIAPNAGVGNTVAGNFIGVDRGGTLPIPNKYGVLVAADSQTIGAQNNGNTLGFNEKAGIWIAADTASANPVVENVTAQYNLVGTNGTADIGNVEIGILLSGSATNNTVTRNIVSGNDGFGIVVADGASSNAINLNLVGTNTAGNAAIPNGGGIWIRQADDNSIDTNLVSGNAIGILVGTDIGFGPTRTFIERFNTDHPVKRTGEADYTSGNRLIGNIVGLNAARNAALPSAIGIAIGENARDNQIGDPGNYNLVSGNTTSLGYGIFIGTLNTEPAEDVIPQFNRFQGNVVGLDGSLETPIANNVGFVLLQAKNNLIGGETRDLGNTIVGSTEDGIQVTDGSFDNSIIGNFIGTLPPSANRSGNNYRFAKNGLSFGNGGNGIKMIGRFARTKLGRNIIGNSLRHGLFLESQTLPNSGEPHTEISGNAIGVIASATGEILVPIANGLAGIFVQGTKGVQIGGQGTGDGNIIGSNGQHGIVVMDSSPTSESETPTVIEGNSIGARLGQGQTLANIGNGLAGIFIERTDRVQIGSAAAGNLVGNNLLEGIRTFNSERISIESNAVVKNQSAGISIFGGALAKIAANSVGLLDSLGAPGNIFGNLGDGVVIEQSPGAVIGGETQSTWNRIGANIGNGLAIKATHPTANFPAPTVITGNLVGGRTTGFGSIVSRASNAVGIRIDNSSNIQIGSFNPAASNSVVASTGAGLRISGNLSTAITTINNAFGKVLTHHGTEGEPMGNGGDGILLEDGANNNTIGDDGDQPPPRTSFGGSSNGNLIATNGRNGITLAATAGNDNRIGGNRIFGNTNFGIDLGGNGFTLNDPGDADTGPNKLQNYPDIFSKQVVNDDLIVTFRVDSAPENSTYGKSGIYVEFFSSDATGQGERFLGSAFYTLADYNSRMPGIKTVNLGNVVTLGYTPDDPITATATDADGNTSEFTPQLIPSSAGVEISGRVTTANGSPIRGAVVTISGTDGFRRSVTSSGFGHFRFEEIPVGKTYLVETASRRYRFEPRLLSVLDSITDLQLIGTEQGGN